MRHARAFHLALAVIVCSVTACTVPNEETREETSANGPWRGELVVTILDSPRGSQTLHFLRTAGSSRRLVFASAPDLAAGTPVRVWGTEAGGAVNVTRLEREEPGPVEGTRRALIGAPSNPLRRWAFVLIDFGMGVNLTVDQARQKAFSDAPTSLKSYFHEVSYGVQEIDGEVLGPIKHPLSDCSISTMSDLADSVRGQINGTFNQYLWYLGKDGLNCDWGGLGDLGTAQRPARDSWYNAWSACGVLIQEPGHNFGMDHSSSLRCTNNGQGVSMALPDQGTCKHSEYGNIFDPMGDGECVHMDGVQKAYQGWLSGCNVVKVTQSGTFTLFPIEKACAGMQLLQIPLPAARTLKLASGSSTMSATLTSYYLELRAPIGLDAGMSARVLVTAAGDVRAPDRSGRHNWLLDMTPETTTVKDAALPVGRAFSDPAPGGPKFTVLSADAGKAVIQVELAGAAGEGPGAGICEDGMAFTAPGPDTCAPAQVSLPDGGAGSDGSAEPRDAGGTRDAGREAGPEVGREPDAGSIEDGSVGGLEVGVATGGSGGGGAGGTGGGPGETAPPGPGQPGGAVNGGVGCRCALGGGQPGAGPWLLAALVLVLRRRRRSVTLGGQR